MSNIDVPVKVFLRIRKSKSQPIVSADENVASMTNPRNPTEEVSYSFDQVFGESASQVNSCVFSYSSALNTIVLLISRA